MIKSRRTWLVGVGMLMLAGCFADPTPTPQAMIEVSATPRPTQTDIPLTATPDQTATPTPCVVNATWQDTYTVKAGDTLAQIAYLLGISVEALAQGNCLVRQDFVYVGQLLYVPNAFALGLATDREAAAVSILFVRDEGEFRNLWGVRSNGVAPQRLTSNMLINAPPVRSNDLTQVALRGVSWFHVPDAPTDAINLEALPSDIWLVATDGAGLRLLIEQGPFDAFYRSAPAWSPDGTLLAFIEQRDAIGSLILIQSNGRNRQVVFTADFTPPNQNTPINPVWSPDGQQIAVVAWEADNRAGLYLLTPEIGTLPTALYSSFLYMDGPFWVPLDGVNGRPAVAIQTLNTRFRPQWQVVDIERGTAITRESGLRLVSPNVGWFAAPHPDGVSLYGIHSQSITVLPTTLAHISFAPQGEQMIAGMSDAGMDYLRLDEPLRQTILGGSVLYPVWAPPQYVVLP